MATRSYDERIAELQKKQEQLKAQEKVLKKRQSEAERKARTRRLIEIGGIVAHILHRDLTDDDKMKFLNFLEMQERNGKYFSRAMNAELAKKENPDDLEL